MRLVDAFGVKPKEVISFVGAGGKTTAMFRLADELAAPREARRVVTTTTTRIFLEQTRLASYVVRVEGLNYARALVEIRKALKQTPHVLVVSAATEDDKALGVDPMFVDQIVALDPVDVVLIEADGARMKSFKAPNDHEPVIPSSTTLLVPVVGMDILGLPLVEEFVHRPERITALTESAPGATVDATMIARVMLNENGGMRNRPWHAPALPLLNRVTNETQLAAARTLANQLLHNELIEAVAIGAVQDATDPIHETHRRVTAIVFAAGAGTRMQGRIKQLLEWDNTSLLAHALQMVRDVPVSQRIVVLGANADLISAQVDLSGFHVVHNAEWEEGRAASLRASLSVISERSEAAIFINADQPFLTPEIIHSVIQRYYQTSAPAVVPVYEAQRGSPVLFARPAFNALGGLKGEEGGRDLLAQYGPQVADVRVDDPRAAIDVDTYEEYERARKLLGQN